MASAEASPKPIVTIVPTGAANLASITAAMRRCGAQVAIADDGRAVDDAERLVLPGVGAFGAAMESLRRRGLDEPLRRRIADGRATLAVCLGLQLLFAASDESPGVEGLSTLDGSIDRIEAVTGARSLRVPHMGWNVVEPGSDCRLIQPGAAYFANSYCLRRPPAGWAAAWTRHGEPFVAAIERGPILACQFHPELSGAWGKSLVERWLARTSANPAGFLGMPTGEGAPC